jgi:multidrug efflux pump subunit AcrA (membrane-fusion protein)
MKTKTVLLFLLTGLLFAACSASGGQPTAATPTPIDNADTTLVAEGRLEPVRFAEIAFTASGVISEVLVEEGQAVEKGQALIQLGDESDTNYAAAQLELVNAQKALKDLQNAAGEDLAQVVIDLKDASEKYNKAQDYLTYLKNKHKVWQTDTRRILVQTRTGYVYRTKIKSFRGPVPQDWIIDAENDLALKKARMEDLQRAYDRLKDGADKDELAVLEARLQAARAGVAAFSVLAPFNGVVADLQAKAGNSIAAGEIAVTVADFSEWLVKTSDLTEIDVVQLTEEQPVIVTLDALPGVELKGEILSIGQSYAEKQGDIVYEVTILLAEAHPAMRWGMTATVNFEILE